MNIDLFEPRLREHDELENKVMGIIRPHTTRKHMPDRFVSFNERICAFDVKTNVFVEDNSYDEYFRLLRDDNIPVFIVYQDKNNGGLYADWIENLEWWGPTTVSPRATTYDDFYRISGGRPLTKFLADEANSSYD